MLSSKVVIDKKKRNMRFIRRSRVRRPVTLALLAVFSFCWLCLYVDSVRQRQKAESLFADLKSFPFASADFSQVREFVLRHDGTAMQEFPPSHFPGLSLPFPDSQGRMNFRLIPTAPTAHPEIAVLRSG
jgi:hypothetical protein